MDRSELRRWFYRLSAQATLQGTAGFRRVCAGFFLLLATLSSRGQTQKYGNVDGFPDSVVLSYLRQKYPNDKLAKYLIEMNGRKEPVKNYYDYLAFQAILPPPVDSAALRRADSIAVARRIDSVAKAATDSLARFVRDVVAAGDTTRALPAQADSLQGGSAADSAARAGIRPKEAATAVPDRAADSAALARDVMAGFLAQEPAPPAGTESSPAEKAAAEKLAAEKSPAEKAGLEKTTAEKAAAQAAKPASGALSLAQVLGVADSTTAGSSAQASADSAGHTADSAHRATSDSARTFSADTAIVAAPAIPDTVTVINFGPNVGNRGTFMLVTISHEGNRDYFVLGEDSFQEETKRLQAFTEKAGPRLQPYLVELWDLFVKCRQGVMYTPLYLHEPDTAAAVH